METERTPRQDDPMPRSRSAMIIERAPLPIVEVQGSAHMVSHVNSAFCRLLGKTREDLIGKSFAEIVHGGDHCMPILDRIYQTGEGATHVQEDDSDSDLTSWLYAMWPALDANEQPVGVIIQLAKTANLRQETIAVNEALLIAGLRQHELTEAAEKLNGQLRGEIVERKVTEAALQESEDRYRVLYAALPVAAFVCDRNAVIQNYNRRAVELWGREPKVGVEQHCGSVKLILPDGSVLPHAQSPMMEVLRTGTACRNVEVSIERPDGSRLPVIVNFCALKDAQGEIVGTVTSFDDITERKWAEEVQSRLGAIVSSADDGILSKTLDGVVTTWNASAERLFGYTAKEIIGKSSVHLTPPDLLREEEHILKQILAGKAIKHLETERMTKDGRRLQVSLTISPIKDATGKVVGASKIVRDITERKKAEETLRESEERFRVAALAVSDLIWTNNAQGMMEGEQPGWAQFTGQTLEEYQGYGWARAVHPDDAQPTIEAWNAAVAEKRLFEFEHRVRRHDGAWRSCSIRAVPVIGGDGEIREWVGVHNDITERKHSDEALRMAMEEIERGSSAKDDFLAALSHELRTPLTPVLMMAADLAVDPALPIEVRDQLAMMRRNIELEARLIDDLLDITRISRGKLAIAPVPTDLHELIQHTAEIVRSDELTKQVRTVLILEAERHYALADPARLQQVIWNLIKNALKFTPTGGTITVSTRNDVEGWIVVSVEDTGIGISAAALPHVFKAFEQGDIAGQHRYGGLGLGLAISHAIVEVHGGALRAESPGLGLGATFSISLDTVDAPAASAPAATRLPAPRRTLRLLIVEDHEATRGVLTRLLARDGHTVTATGTIHEALLAFGAARFDLVVSDLGLPDGSGLDLMRELQRRRPVPGIALSGYGMAEDVRQTEAAGFFAHLVKPVNIEQLRRLLDELGPRPEEEMSKVRKKSALQ